MMDQDEGRPWWDHLHDFQQKFVMSLALGIAVVLVLALYGNATSLLHLARNFRWSLLPLILALTVFNYALRCLKWTIYLDRISAGATLGDSVAIFCAGLSMAVTPGKVGEILKPGLLRVRTGTPISKSAPVVVAERLTDGIAMAFLALSGLALSRGAWPVLVASVLLAFVLAVGLGTGPGTRLVRSGSTRIPALNLRLGHVDTFLLSSRTLLAPRLLLLGVSIGIVSWSGEAIAFYLVLIGLGVHASLALLLQATFVLSTSTLVGSLSMLPGGLGAADASVAVLLVVVAHLSAGMAAAATLLIRFATLWFGVAVGVLALWIFRRRFGEGRGAETRDIGTFPAS